MVSVKEAGQIFYSNLFEMDPSTRSLFKADMSEEETMLIQMVNESVRLLSNLEDLLDEISDLGKRHTTFNVTPDHFKVVGEAFIKTLQDVLKDKFDEPTMEVSFTPPPPTTSIITITITITITTTITIIITNTVSIITTLLVLTGITACAVIK